MSNATMARPKKSVAKQAEEAPAGPRPTALTIKGTLEWRKWVERGAEHCRTDVAKMVDAALIRYLRDQGFTEAPPKR